ncbi:MAG: GntR family transcriptional regulator [Granulosicoccus sp.]
MSEKQSSVKRVYNEVRRMAIDFSFKPGQRINESVLASQLNASRTPLREALNRLTAEGYLSFEAGAGFSCRSLSAERIVELYELRVAIECESLRCAVLRASDHDIAALHQSLDESEHLYNKDSNATQLLEMDEAFHEQLVALSGNQEFIRLLVNLNGRIRFIRLMDFERMRKNSNEKCTNPVRLADHRTIVSALELRDVEAALKAMRGHIQLRLAEATLAVRDAYAQLYAGNEVS